MHPQTKNWAKILVIGIVIIVIVALVLVLSKNDRSSGGLTDKQKQEIIDALERQDAQRQPAPQLSEGEKAEILNQLQAQTNLQQENEFELSDDDKAAILDALEASSQ